MLKNYCLTKLQQCEHRQFFLHVFNRGFACAMNMWATQLLTQLLMDQFDTLPLQYKQIGHLFELV